MFLFLKVWYVFPCGIYYLSTQSLLFKEATKQMIKIQPNNLWHKLYSLPRFEEEVSSYSSTSSTLQENETKEVPKKTYFRSPLNSETVCYLCLIGSIHIWRHIFE